MKRDQILQLFKDLARSQGMYGRLLRDIESLDFDRREKFWTTLEDKNFKEPVDVILYLES